MGLDASKSSTVRVSFDRLATLSSAVLCDVMEAMGLPERVLSNALQRLVPGQRACGPAFCVTGRETSIAYDGLPAAGFELDRRLADGSVVVVETGGHHASSIFGGNVALALKRRGCAGVIVDGTLRDVDEWAELPLAAFGRGLTPKSNKGRWRVVDLEQSIEMPGQTASTVVVSPGDAVVGDADGIVVIPQEHLAAVVELAAQLEIVEGRIKNDLARGADREAVYARHDRFAHIRRLVV